MPIDRFIADFCCADAKLIIELDGGQHDQQQARDQNRTAVLELIGYLVLRFWNNDVIRNMDGVLEEILGTLERSGPTPTLSPRGEGARLSLGDVDASAQRMHFECAIEQTLRELASRAHPRARRRHGHHDPALGLDEQGFRGARFDAWTGDVKGNNDLLSSRSPT